MELLIPMILKEINGIGVVKTRKIIENNNLPKGVSDIREWLGLVLNKEGISSYNLNNDELKKIIERINKLKEYQLKNEIKSVSILDDRYPILLKQINNAPIVLHYKGNLNCLINEKIVSVVGTRYPTDNGVRVSYKTAKYFAEKNYSVVSGLALGCDTYAHRATVEINKSTIAVMPCGLDTIIPKINSKLADKILSTNGCIISEYICGSVISKYNYVNRNRIQSGLSKAILVVETGEKGGTIETIKHGLNQKKIIGCYDSDEYYDNILGNRKFISEGKAYSYKSIKDLNRIDEKIQESLVYTKQLNFNI